MKFWEIRRILEIQTLSTQFKIKIGRCRWINTLTLSSTVTSYSLAVSTYHKGFMFMLPLCITLALNCFPVWFLLLVGDFTYDQGYFWILGVSWINSCTAISTKSQFYCTLCLIPQTKISIFSSIITNTRSAGAFSYSENISTPTIFASDNRKIHPRWGPFTFTAHMHFVFFFSWM